MAWYEQLFDEHYQALDRLLPPEALPEASTESPSPDAVPKSNSREVSIALGPHKPTSTRPFGGKSQNRLRLEAQAVKAIRDAGAGTRTGAGGRSGKREPRSEGGPQLLRRLQRERNRKRSRVEPREQPSPDVSPPVQRRPTQRGAPRPTRSLRHLQTMGIKRQPSRRNKGGGLKLGTQFSNEHLQNQQRKQQRRLQRQPRPVRDRGDDASGGGSGKTSGGGGGFEEEVKVALAAIYAEIMELPGRLRWDG